MVPLGSHAALLRGVAAAAAGGAGLLASSYDGTNDHQLRGADLTGIADSKEFVLSYWWKFNNFAAAKQLSQSTDLQYKLSINSGIFSFRLEVKAAGTVELDIRSSGTDLNADTNWHHYLASANMGVSNASWIYVDDSASLTRSKHTLDAVLEWSAAEHSVASDISGNSEPDIRLSEYYFITGAHIDLTTEANRRLFINSSGLPEDLGADGTTPGLGTPHVFAANGDMSTNLGGGGDYVLTGAVDSVAGPGA